MEIQEATDFYHYLTVKKKIDDRSLNRYVYGVLARQLAKLSVRSTLNILELGAGNGTMISRLLEWGLLRQASYKAVDSNPDFIFQIDQYFVEWAKEWDYQYIEIGPTSREIKRPGQLITLELFSEPVQEFLAHEPETAYDLVIAHAFLDLVDLDEMLPNILPFAKPEGFYYFTLNFDGQTIFEPAVGPQIEEQIIALYHESMDQRVVEGLPAGDSQTGRKLISLLQRRDCPLLAAGSSDWVVHAGQNGFTPEEKFFLNYILTTIETSIQDTPELDKARISNWFAERRKQIEAGTLVYIAHQIDLLAKPPQT